MSATVYLDDHLPIVKYQGLNVLNATVTLPATTTIGGSTVSALGVITSASTTALAVGLAGATNSAFVVDSSTASQAAGLKVTGAATGGTVAVAAIDSGSNTNVTLDGKGTGTVKIATTSATSGQVTIGNSTAGLGVFINGPIQVDLVPTAVNSTATLTSAQVATGYITSTSAAAVTMTLPTGTLLGGVLGATSGTIFDLYIDNTAGANTVTMAVATNGIKSDAANTTAGSFGQLTVASGATGLGCFRLMFSSATAYVFTRIA